MNRLSLFTLVFTVVAFCSLGLLRAETPDKEPGSWDFSLYTFQGDLYKLEKTRTAPSNKVVVVDFFSRYCKPCLEALPEWKKVYKKQKKRGLQMVLVALPARDDRDKAKQELQSYLDKHPMPFPVAFDKYSMVGEQYGVVTDNNADLPQSFLIASDGTLLAKGRSPADLEDEIQNALSNPARPAAPKKSE